MTGPLQAAIICEERVCRLRLREIQHLSVTSISSRSAFALVAGADCGADEADVSDDLAGAGAGKGATGPTNAFAAESGVEVEGEEADSGAGSGSPGVTTG